MMRRLLIAALLIAFALATMGAESCDTTTSEPAKVSTSDSNPEAAGDEAAAPDPKADIQSTCDYVLGDFTTGPSGYRALGQAKIHNTGNIGVKVRLTARWEQLGTSPLRMKKTVRVRRGHTRTLRFTLSLTQDQVDLHQSADAECKVTGKIVDTFGKAA